MSDETESARPVPTRVTVEGRADGVREPLQAVEVPEATGSDRDRDGQTTDGCLDAGRIGRIQAVVRAVAACDARDAAERTACDGLAAVDPYRSAWIGVPALDDGGLAVRAKAGEEPDRRDASSPATCGEGSPDRRPCRRALRTGEVQVAVGSDVDAAMADGGDDSGVGTGEYVGFGNGDDGDAGGSVVAVPLGDDDATHGVLAVNAAGEYRPDDAELAALDGVGTVLSLVGEAERHRDLVFAEHCVEVTVSLTDAGSPLVRLSDELDCRVAVDGSVALDDGWRLYCDVAGSRADAVAAAVEEDPALANCRTIVDRADGCWVGVETGDTCVLDRAAAAGASVDAAVADDGACRVRLELPPSGDVRETVARLRETYPDLELRSRRDADRSVATRSGSVGVFDELTDRQREVLEVAFRAGYFEWPRENTAEDIAPDLGIASSTLHWHLRAAERNLLETLLG